VFAVGQRVCVQLADSRLPRVPLGDEAGTRVVGSLANGAQVEILAWRPRESLGVRYQVRATDNGLHGWLGVTSLRAPTVVVEPDTATTPELVLPAERRDTARRFGER
jgi:hypothetical protein